MPKEAAAGPHWMCRLGRGCSACRAPWPILAGLLAPSSWCLPVRHLISSVQMHLRYIFRPHIDCSAALHTAPSKYFLACAMGVCLFGVSALHRYNHSWSDCHGHSDVQGTEMVRGDGRQKAHTNHSPGECAWERDGQEIALTGSETDHSSSRLRRNTLPT